VRAVAEGAFVGNFDPGYYKSDRKDNDQKIDEVTIVVHGDTKPWKAHCKPAASLPSRRTSRAIW